MHQHQWNYHDEDPLRGPKQWAKQYPSVGQAQSPIDIQVDYCDLQSHQQQVNCCCNDNIISTLDEQMKQVNIKQQNKKHQLQQQQQQRNHLRPHLGSTGEFELDEEEEEDDDNDFDNEYNDNNAADNHHHRTTSISSNKTFSKSNHSHQHDHHQEQRNNTNNNNNNNNKQQQKQIGDIQNTRYCATNKKIFLGYPRYLNNIKLCNTGHAWQIDMPPEVAQHTLLCGPPLGDREYRLAQLHCHWGSQCDQGSEHLVNGRAYSAEIHFVHWNCKEFSSFEEAARHKHGLAVLAVFVQALEGDRQHCNKHLDKIIGALPRVADKPHSSYELHDARLDLKKLFPANRWLYVSYEGSLTTPPLSEVVDWVVFLQPIQCSRRQIEAFRELKCPVSNSTDHSEKLSKNCRPVQPHNNRTVNIWTHSGAGSGSGSGATASSHNNNNNNKCSTNAH